MKIEIEKITVSIGREEAVQIINALHSGIPENRKNDLPTDKAAEIERQLRTIFMSGVKGVHFA